MPGWEPVKNVSSLAFEQSLGSQSVAKSCGAMLGSSEDVRPHPWMRYFARVLDLYAFTILIGVASAIVIPQLAPFHLEVASVSEFWMLMFLFPLLMFIPLESLFLCTCGTTPGKWMFGLRVETHEGGMPDFSTALRRSALVWWRGLALGAPIVCLFTLNHAKNVLDRAGVATWDRDMAVQVWHRKATTFRVAVWSGLVVLVAVVITQF